MRTLRRPHCCRICRYGCPYNCGCNKRDHRAWAENQWRFYCHILCHSVSLLRVNVFLIGVRDGFYREYLAYRVG